VPPLRTDQELVGFGKGSFGRAYHEHLSHNNLKAQFYRSPRVTRPLDYISLRLYQTHDLWHVLLGYDTSPRGEIEVQAFTLAQLRTPISCLLLVGGLLNILANRPASSVPVFSAAVMAHQRGQRCPFLLAYRLEGMLTEPLVRVREAVGLTSEQTAA
jgi:ubiquinone biosynthesis protein Coq4